MPWSSPLREFRLGLQGSRGGSASLAEPVSGDNAGTAGGAEVRSPFGHWRRCLPAQEGILVLDREQQHGRDQADERQPAGSRVQETLAFYARARIEHGDGVAAGRKAGGRRQVNDRE